VVNGVRQEIEEGSGPARQYMSPVEPQIPGSSRRSITEVKW